MVRVKDIMDCMEQIAPKALTEQLNQHFNGRQTQQEEGGKMSTPPWQKKLRYRIKPEKKVQGLMNLQCQKVKVLTSHLI